MKWLLVSSVLLVAILGLCLIPQANAVPVVYNTNAVSITWNTQARTSLTSDIFTEPGYNGTITGWFHIVNGSTTVSKILGSGAASVTIQCNYNINNGGVGTRTIVSNDTNLYYACGSGAGPYPFYKTDINTGTSTIRGHVLNVGGGFTSLKSFVGANNIYAITYQLGAFPSKFASVGIANFSIGSTGASTGLTNQKFFNDKQFTFNTVIPATNATYTGNSCELKYMPTNATLGIDSIACDSGIPNHSDHFWYGMKPDRVGNYVTNSSYPMIQSIYSSQYQDILTLPDAILGITGPDVRFILHAGTTDYMLVMTSSTIYYTSTSNIISALSGHAMQTYMITTTSTSSNFEIPSTLLQNAQLLGPAGFNQTISAYGIMSIPSGYTLRLSTYTQSTIRTLDPQWTNDNTLYPTIRTGTQSLFPVILTVNNAPTDASLIFTNPNVNLAYTYEPNLKFWLSPAANTLDYISRTYSRSTDAGEIVTTWGSYAKNFTGSNYLQYNQTYDLNTVDYNTPLSVSFWIKTTSAGTAYDIVSKDSGVNTRGFFVRITNTAHAQFALINTFTTNEIAVQNATMALNDGVYHHVVFTYDGSAVASGVKMYIDGSQVTTQINFNTLTSPITTTKALIVGADGAGAGRFTGTISDVKIYGAVLSAADVSSLFAHSNANPATETFGSTGEVWTVTRLDSTRTAEFDIPLGTCGNVYVADNSVSPFIYNYEGNICATGSNVKTISYTNTLPLNFWNLPYGVTHNFVPATNGLTTTFHTTSSPVTYKVIIKNSTGAITQNQSFTLAANSTLDIRNFNTTNATKPAGLFVYVGSSLIYSAYMGSALSLASVASFFNTYLSYQGFSLLAFIPIIFAAMFTRNTVGIGVVLTVLCIATLSWLSIVVIPDAYIAVMMLIGIIGLIAYRIYYG